MIQRLRQWYQGKDIRVDPDEPDTLGGAMVLHDYYKEFHWSAKAVRSWVAFYLRHWQWLWGMAVTAITIYVSVLALK